MKENKISLKTIINQSISATNGKCGKMFISSILLFSIFLIAYLLTGSLLVSFVLYGLFLPTEIAFLNNLNDENVHIEHIFKFKNQFVTYLLLSLFCFICYFFGVLVLIVPAVIFLLNFVFAFDIARDGSNNMAKILSQSKELAKGHRGKIFLLSAIFFFLFVLLAGLGILLVWLISLVLPAFSILIYTLGTMIGLSVFLAFVTPVMLICFSNLRGAIEQSHIDLAKSTNKENKEEPIKVSEEDVIINEPNNMQDPTDYIV